MPAFGNTFTVNGTPLPATYLGLNVMGVVTIPASIMVLDPGASGALSLSENSSINLATGSVLVDSSSPTALTVTDNAKVTAASIFLNKGGGYSTGGKASLSVTPTPVSFYADPLVCRQSSIDG